MRKLTAIILVFVLLFGLVGCKRKQSETTPQKSQYSLADILFYHADNMARQIGMSADPAYLKQLDYSEKLVAMASVFSSALKVKPEVGNLIAITDPAFEDKMLELCGKAGGAEKLACTSALTYTTHFYSEKPIKQTVAAYVRYDAKCHFVVVFRQLSNHMVSATAYPLFAESARAVLSKFFTNAVNYNKEEVASSCETGAAQSYAASLTGKTVDANYYIGLAETVFADYPRPEERTFTPYTTDSRLISQAMLLSKTLASGIRSARVYQFPESVQTQIRDALSNAKYGEDLQHFAAQQTYLSWSNTFAGTYGDLWLQTSSLVQVAVKTNDLGAAAQAGETPVLVLLELKGEYCVMLSICPTENNTYVYSYTCLPCEFADAQSMLDGEGAKLMQ